MKQLKCEMCGSTDIVKQDGMFVCQVCGTKYSVEEAKKMMIEGTVEVTGSVKIDSSDELEKLYKVARIAKEEGNFDDAVKYYEKILEKDSTSWEAYFYIVYFKNKGMNLYGGDNSWDEVISSFGKCLKHTLMLIEESEMTKENKIVAIKEFAEKSKDVAMSFVSRLKISYECCTPPISGEDYAKKNLIYYRYDSARKLFYSLGDGIEEQFGDYDELRPIIIDVWKIGTREHAEPLQTYVVKIQKYEPDYHAPEDNNTPQYVIKKGCYVATCVYGSYDCPEVWTLRRYRDSKLGASHGGRAFIRLYYAISPTLVKWFGNTNWFKKMWRGVLDKKVKKLQAQGYESTPYDDIDWRK